MIMVDYTTWTAINCLVTFVIGVGAGILVGYGYFGKERL